MTSWASFSSRSAPETRTERSPGQRCRRRSTSHETGRASSIAGEKFQASAKARHRAALDRRHHDVGRQAVLGPVSAADDGSCPGRCRRRHLGSTGSRASWPRQAPGTPPPASLPRLIFDGRYVPYVTDSGRGELLELGQPVKRRGGGGKAAHHGPSACSNSMSHDPLKPVWPVTSPRRPRRNPGRSPSNCYQGEATGIRQRSASSSRPAFCSSRTLLMRR